MTECIEDLSHNYTYYLTYTKPDFSEIHGAGSKDLLGYFIGLCLPKQCGPEDIKNVPIFESSTVFAYENSDLGVFAWIGIVTFMIYVLVIIVATLVSAVKNVKGAKGQKEVREYNSGGGRLSINDTEGNVNHSTNESLHEPLTGGHHGHEHKVESLATSFSCYENYSKIFTTAPNRNILYGPKCIAVLMIIVAY